MTLVVVDANVWVSALLAADGNHALSRAWLFGWRSAGNTFAGPALLMTEVGCAIGRDANRSAAASVAVADIATDLTVRLIPIKRALAREAADLGIQARFRGADALYVAVAKRLRVPIVTWDKEILSSASKVGVDARVPTV